MKSRPSPTVDCGPPKSPIVSTHMAAASSVVESGHCPFLESVAYRVISFVFSSGLPLVSFLPISLMISTVLNICVASKGAQKVYFF